MQEYCIFSLTLKNEQKRKKGSTKIKNESHRSDKNKSGYALNVEQILDGLIIQFVTLVIVKRKRAKEKSIGWEDTIFLGDLNTIKVQVLEVEE